MTAAAARHRHPNRPGDRDIARAQALGRLAAATQAGLEANPYPLNQRGLRLRWAMAYVRAGGLDQALEETRGRVRRWLGGGDG